MYKLMVVKIESLTDEEQTKRERHYTNYGGPNFQNLSPNKEVRVIEVELKDEEYDVLRQALVQYWDKVS